MLHSLEKARQGAVVSAVNAFMRRPGYIILLAAVAALSSVFALDLVAYSLVVLAAIYILLLGEDLLPIMPMVMLCYIMPSLGNNPGRNPDSIFYPQNGGYYLIGLASVMVIALIFRLATDKEIGGKAFFTAKRSLLWGMIALGVAYLLSGIGLSNYKEIAGKNLVFAALQFFSVVLLYYIFAGAVKWDRVPKNYLAWIGLCVGAVVFVQLMENYWSGRLMVDGSINRYNIATGWGMHNNVGGLMAMMIPFCFYLACKEKRGWIFNLVAIVLMLGVVLTFSRSSMLTGGIAFAICALILLIRYDKGRKNLLLYGLAVAGALVLLLVFREKVFELVREFLSKDLFAVNSRDKLLINGLKQFKAHPVFGGSFYPQGDYVPWDWSDLEAFSSFFPPRWHNTITQLLASAGAVGIAAYAIHRFQTVKLLLTKRSMEKTFIIIYLGVLLGASMFDCHFFNIGPVLFYSMALAFAEKIEQTKL